MSDLLSIEKIIAYLENAGYRVQKKIPGRVDSSFMGWQQATDVHFDSASDVSDLNNLRLDVLNAQREYEANLAGNKTQEPEASSSASIAELRMNAERARLDANKSKVASTAKPRTLEELRLDSEKARQEMIERYRS
jgi:hypothetical protein